MFSGKGTNRNKYASMNTSSKNIIILLFVTGLLALANLGCHTANGFGKDVSDTGNKIQKNTK
jgi:predicted small secreted protein